MGTCYRQNMLRKKTGHACACLLNASETRIVFFYNSQHIPARKKKLEIHIFSHFRDQFTDFLTSGQILGKFVEIEVPPTCGKSGESCKIYQKSVYSLQNALKHLRNASNHLAILFLDRRNNQQSNQLFLSSEIEDFEIWTIQKRFAQII